jgi:hypothetical protein
MTNIPSDAVMVERVMDWPRWPVLPLVSKTRVSDDEMCGFLFADLKPVVYLDNLFSLSERVRGTGAKMWSDVLAPLPRKEYGSVGELLKEWRVD